MKAISNKKGSAMLWTVLLTVIITILLGAVMTATYAFYNYTMYSVKRQQAYFTARSATNALIDEFSNQEQKPVTAADGSVSYEDVDPAILPVKNTSIEVSDFGFPAEMGTATAVIKRDKDDEVDLSVTATYADEHYTIKSTVARQPLYFAGVAINNLTLNGGNLTLGENTDLYWNNTKILDLRNQNGYKINMSGSLVTKGDSVIASGTNVAHHKFQKDVTFSRADSRYIRKIWSPSEYIISNKTLKTADGSTISYDSTIVNTLKNITNYTFKYCNNSVTLSNQYFGFPSLLDTSLFQGLLGFIGMDNIYNDMKNQTMSVTKQDSDALAIKYIKLLSLSQTVKNYVDNKKTDGNWFEQFAAKAFDAVMGDFINNNALRVFDVSYIEFNARDENTRDDDVIPIVYLFVTGGPENGLTVRVKYGKDPDKASLIYQATDDLKDFATSLINNAFKIKNNMSYVIVYLEPNSKIELGCLVGGRNDKKEDLVFAYSIYGDETTTVVLNRGVTVLGEIYCGHLQVNGDAQIIYTNSSGSQIAKQKISEYWTIVNFSD